MLADSKTDEPRRELSASARRWLSYMAEQLRDGYSGTFIVECREGGVREFRSNKILGEADLRGIR